MNYSTAIFLVNDDVRAVGVTYEPGDPNEKTKDYSFKTFEKSLAVGDYVVVPTGTRHGMTVCRVKEINVNIDLNSTIEFKWIVGRVDKSEYDRIIELEKKVIDAVKVADFETKRDELRRAMTNTRMNALRHLELTSIKEPAIAPAADENQPK
jgi:cupin superfamily acireductone dioxygenase involved in methionine salvage